MNAYNEEDPVAAILRLTGRVGVDRAINAVGVDAHQAEQGPARADHATREQFERELDGAMPDEHWKPGDAPSQVLRWAGTHLAKAGTLSIIGVYPATMMSSPIGMALNTNLSIRMGNCNHRKYMPGLVELVRNGTVDPLKVLTKRRPMTSVIDASKAFAEHRPGWIKVELDPSA